MWKREHIIRFFICLIHFVRLPILVSKELKIFPGLCSLWWPCSTFMACSAFNNIQSRTPSFSVIHKGIGRLKLSAIQAMPHFTATKIQLLSQERNRRGGEQDLLLFPWGWYGEAVEWCWREKNSLPQQFTLPHAQTVLGGKATTSLVFYISKDHGSTTMSTTAHEAGPQPISSAQGLILLVN